MYKRLYSSKFLLKEKKRKNKEFKLNLSESSKKYTTFVTLESYIKVVNIKVVRILKLQECDLE